MKLIALDLDGTLLNSEKVISAGNFAALSMARTNNSTAPRMGKGAKRNVLKF